MGTEAGPERRARLEHGLEGQLRELWRPSDQAASPPTEWQRHPAAVALKLGCATRPPGRLVCVHTRMFDPTPLSQPPGQGAGSTILPTPSSAVTPPQRRRNWAPSKVEIGP